MAFDVGPVAFYSLAYRPSGQVGRGEVTALQLWWQ